MNLDAPELHRIRRFLASVQAGFGQPEDPRQKGEGGFFPGLKAQPWHDAQDFPSTRSVTAVLEGHAPTVIAEHRRFDPTGLIAHPASFLHPDLEGRDWGFFELWNGGRFGTDAERFFPETCAAIRDVEAFLSPAGQVAFHRLEPGARLRPHADGPNTTLTCHLGIDVPAGCGLRVAGETRSWQNGRCLWFDHSYEHDAWNNSDRPRTILLLDVLHPDITGLEVQVWRRMFEAQRERT